MRPIVVASTPLSVTGVAAAAPGGARDACSSCVAGAGEGTSRFGVMAGPPIGACAAEAAEPGLKPVSVQRSLCPNILVQMMRR